MSNNKDMLNKPMVVQVGGKKITVKRLSVIQLLSVAEDYFLKKKREQIQKTADLLPAKDRSEFIVEQGMSLLDGYELEVKAKSLLNKDMPDELAYMLAWEAIKDHTKISYDDMVILIDDSPQEETQRIYYGMRGKEPSPAGVKSKPSEKSGAGRQK